MDTYIPNERLEALTIPRKYKVLLGATKENQTKIK